MVNGWLKSAILGGAKLDARRRQQNQRIFATKSALTSKSQRGRGNQKSFWIKRFLVY
jgi:hypothetical protein